MKKLAAVSIALLTLTACSGQSVPSANTCIFSSCNIQQERIGDPTASSSTIEEDIQQNSDQGAGDGGSLSGI